MVAIPLWQYCTVTVPLGLSHWSKYVYLVCGSLYFLLYLLIGLFARTTFLIFVCVIVALASIYVCSPLHYMFACDGFMYSLHTTGSLFVLLIQHIKFMFMYVIVQVSFGAKEGPFNVPVPSDNDCVSCCAESICDIMF